MNIAVIDDNDSSCLALVSAILAEQPNASVEVFSSLNQTLVSDFAKSCDVAFVSTGLPLLSDDELLVLTSTDLNCLASKEIPDCMGVQLARRLQQRHPAMNIILVSDDDSYCLEAFAMHCSGYIVRPITENAVHRELAHLRFPVSLRARHRLQAHCFGNFELFFDGKPVPFERGKTREMFAYLVNLKGMLCTNGEIEAVLWEGCPPASSYPRVIRNDMKVTLERLGVGDVIVRQQDRIGIDVNALDCDYYDYLRYLAGALPVKPFFNGQYMSQYSWGERTLAYLSVRAG